MSSWLVRVRLDWACFGFVVVDNVVTEAAPIFKWGIGKSGEEAVSYWRKRSASVSWIELDEVARKRIRR